MSCMMKHPWDKVSHAFYHRLGKLQCLVYPSPNKTSPSAIRSHCNRKKIAVSLKDIGGCFILPQRNVSVGPKIPAAVASLRSTPLFLYPKCTAATPHKMKAVNNWECL